MSTTHAAGGTQSGTPDRPVEAQPEADQVDGVDGVDGIDARAGEPGQVTQTGPIRQGPGSDVTGPQARQATHQQAPPRRRREAPAAPRRVKLTVSRLDPWSAMKISFLLSVAAGIAGVVLMSVLWLVLSGMGVFSDVNRAIGQVLGNSTAKFNLMDYIGFDRVVSLSIVIGVIDIVLLTALATLGAVLYNICSSLVGGLQVTLTDD